MPQDAIGLLLELARRGEVDPWDIDVVQLTDRFLASMGELTTRDLALTGQALFYASLLIHLKAQILEARTFPQPVPEELMAEEPNIVYFPLPLEQMLKRRLSAPQNLPQRPLTLQELLAHLKEAEHLDQQKILPLTPSRLPPGSVRTLEQVKELAHQENLEDLIHRVRERVARSFHTDTPLSLEELIAGEDDQLGTFIALLFLAARSLVLLDQEDFYGEIWVSPGERWTLESLTT
ncbi:segregation/condensation protein A [Anthocerotibacter panamensis]|uniref:segregation/condensation protein A n=1 Tax=Anthocerotibacter panamensis TaxID=2857077 RepID=UPI001C407226|nr:ScpA family protein [Anthocerotibacter panamensis]